MRASDWGGQNLSDGAPNGPDVFLSYASEDEAQARELARAVGERGLSVFWDREIPPGQTWHSYVGEALGNARCVVVAWSHHSIVSDWVIEEANEGKRRRILVPVLFEAVQPPFGFGGIQAASLIDWHSGQPSPAFDRLLRAVKRIVGGQAGSGAEAEAPRAARPASSEPAPKSKLSVGPTTPSPASSEPRAAPVRHSHGWARAWSRWTVAAMVAGFVALAGAGGIVWRLTQPGLSIVGRWQGRVVQPGTPPYSTIMQAYSTIMQVNEPRSRGTCGTVDYPELGCGGELHDCKEQSDGSYRMLERINRGQQQQRCFDGGTIQVQLSGGSLTWAWFYPDGREGAAGTLSRTEAPPLDR
jgi:hypothetical protein